MQSYSQENATRQLRIKLFTVLMCCTILNHFAGQGFGQLRSGNRSRTLYHQQLEPKREAPNAANGVQQAGGYSILESAPASEVVTASCVGCDTGCDSCAAPAHTYESDFGCGASGCNGMTCDTCCGGGSSLAPTCTQLCPPGCGPLMALWYRLQVRAEVPIYWRRDQGAPILVTTASSGVGADVAGVIGESTTDTLLGGNSLNNDGSAGVRLTFRTWLGQSRDFGLMLRVWDAGDQDDSYRFDSNSFPILARPFFNTTVDGSFAQDTQLIAFPDESLGDITVNTSSSLSGLELSLRRLLYEDRFTRLDWLYGYQHVNIEEGLTVSSNTTVIGNTPGLQGASIAVTDRFQTNNEFHGVSYGIMSTRRFACWQMETMFRLGAGNLRREVNISGSTTTVSSGTSTDNQGLLARNTNNHPFVDDTFVVIPEVGINFAYLIRPGIHFNVGYNYMLVPKVAQAAQQIDNDLAVNLSDPLVGSLDPQLDFDERNYWINSLGLGLQLRY